MSTKRLEPQTKFDRYDRFILKLLQTNAKHSLTELARKMGLSRTPVHERVRKFERSGIIKGYRAEINPKKIGLQIHAFCNVSLKEHTTDYLETFEHEISEYTQVVAAYHTAGMFDYLLEIRVKDMAEYKDFISQDLAGMQNIGNVQSFFVMDELLSHRVLFPAS